MKNYKKAFSLIEMIFAVVIIGVIASIAMPKLFGTKNEATAVSIKQDLTTLIGAIQGQSMLKNSVEKISDVVTLNNSLWEIEDKVVTFKEKDTNCLVVTLSEHELEVDITEDAGEICQSLFKKGVEDAVYNLN